MTAKNKRIKTTLLTIDNLNLVHATDAIGIIGWTAQDDITIIGAELIIDVSFSATALAEVGGYTSNAALTRAALISQDSEFLRATVVADWLATATFSPSQHASELVMFPEGYGIDMDEGEIVNLIIKSISRATADDTQDMRAVGILHYLDRS